MVQYPRHAVVEFHPDWAIKSWHCVLCGSQCDSQEQLKSHLQIHEIKDVIATVITTGNLPNGASINFKHSFITDSTADVSISTGDVAAHVKKEINDSDDYMPLEEVESDNESFGAKLEPNDDDSEIPEFKIEAVHSDDNEMETSFTYDENANSPEEAIKFNCNYCDKSFDTKPKLERHQKLNHEVLVCPVRNCTQKLVDVNHIMKHSTISPRFKSQRVAQTATKTSLSAGQSSQDEKSSVPVLPPENQLPEPQQISKDLWTSSSLDIDSTQPSVDSASPPVVIHTEIKSEPYVRRKLSVICHHCGAISSSTTHLITHFRSQHLKQFLLCHICGLKLKEDSNRKKHFVRIHKGPKSFSCKACGTSYGTYRFMHEHQVNVHNYNPMAICRLCVKGFNTKEEKDLHEMTFHPGLPESNEVLVMNMNKFFIEKDEKLVLCKHGQLGVNTDDNALYEIEEEIETVDDVFFVPSTKEADEEMHTQIRKGGNKKFEEENPLKRKIGALEFGNDMGISNETKQIAETQVTDYVEHDSNVVLNFEESYERKNTKRVKVPMKEMRKLKAQNRKILKYSQTKNFLCDQCDNSYNKLSSLNKHKLAEHDRQVVLCHICGKADKCKGNRKKHFNHSHKGPKEFECKNCSMCLSSWPYMYLHLKETHGFGKLAVCRLCAEGFESADERVKHEKEMHPMLPEIREDLVVHVNETFIEETPGKYVLSTTVTRRRKNVGISRIKKISDNESAKCEGGPKKRKNAKDKTNSKATSKRAKRLKSEATNSNEQNHKRMKSENRSVKCDQCEFTYTSQNALMRHKRAVHEHVVYLCHICGKADKCKSNWKKHFLRGHKGPMEYQCKKCSLSFATWGNVYLHLRETHGFEKLAVCRLCASGFQSVEDRVDHEKEMHPMLPELKEDLLEHVNEPFVEESPGKYVLCTTVKTRRKQVDI